MYVFKWNDLKVGVGYSICFVEIKFWVLFVNIVFKWIKDKVKKKRKKKEGERRKNGFLNNFEIFLMRCFVVFCYF